MPETTIDTAVRDLSDRDRAVREAAERRLLALGVRGIERLLPHLPDRSVKGVLMRLGDEALPRLREIRRQGPGRLRGRALELLVDLAGADALDEADQAAVERLIQVKLPHEHPVKLPWEAGRWLAFPAERMDDAVAALGLHDLRPVTTVLGVEATTRAEDCLEFQDARGEKRTAYRVFITPEFESWLSEVPIRSWRMVWGNSLIDQLDGFRLADVLSERCGEAHLYILDPYNSAENWYVSRDGRGVRSFGTYDYPHFAGEPLPFEAWYQETAFDEEEAAKYAEGVPDALTAADNLSVEPGLMRDDLTHGHGWLATTEAEVPNSRFRGALPV
ncbi:hypothetical protein [Streptomyces davaonensis]|nr:hypothetical protein [Streptomyces davaonensis]